MEKIWNFNEPIVYEPCLIVQVYRPSRRNILAGEYRSNEDLDQLCLSNKLIKSKCAKKQDNDWLIKTCT